MIEKQNEKLIRLEELEKEAIDNYMENSDFSTIDWINEENKEEYKKLFKEVNNYCLDCGATAGDCECKKEVE